MIDAIGLFGLLLLALSGRSSAAPARRGAPGAKQLPAAAPPWPAAVPDDLPKFPGAGWEYDEPPPSAVQVRAAQLVAPLWRQGKGSFRTEFTAGRWITYRAEIVRSGKHGVVAYRVKGTSTLKRPPGEDEPISRAPQSSAPWSLQSILTSASPGWPQAAPGARVAHIVAGRWYQWTVRVDAPPGMAEGIARGLAASGAVNIAVSTTPPYAVAYQLQAKQSIEVPLGVQLRLEINGVEASITFLDAREIKAPTGPKVPIEKPPPGWVDVNVPAAAPAAPGDIPIATPTGTITARSPLDMPNLQIGARGEDVKIVQQKLGITADGIFGRQTQTAVIEFQRSKGLAPNLPTEQLRARGFGAVKQATWVALFGARA